MKIKITKIDSRARLAYGHYIKKTKKTKKTKKADNRYKKFQGLEC